MTADLSARTGARSLTNDDLYAVVKLLLDRPVHNVFISSRIRHLGLDPFVLGCQVWGYERDGELVALCHAGSNLVPVGSTDPEVLEAFAERCGPARRSTSISGEAEAALGLWDALVQRWGDRWASTREVRRCQPLMMMDTDPSLPGDPDRRVTEIGLEDLDAYFDSAVKMYTEEVGVSPLEPSPATYRGYVRTLITMRRAFGVVEGGRVVFKADLGSVSGRYAQIQGVWLSPELRGQGLAAPLMAEVVRQARRSTPNVSLYVNDYNTPALRTYERVGFQRVGQFATILY